MRGPPNISRRAGTRLPAVNEATARTYALPAPYNGWNARGNLANMGPLDAIVMDNVFPGVQEVSLRPGSIDWVTGFGSNVKALIPYNGATSTKLFASTSTNIYNVTASGAVGASVAACTSGLWESVNYTNTGGSWIVLANGVDNVKVYDGTTWTTVTGVSVPAITGVTTSTLSYVTAHKKRLWFIQKDSMNLWYMPVDSIGGAAAQYPVGALFRKGGYLTAIGTWTIDGGNGTDDYFVIVTSAGEIAIYQGTDPASSSTWALVGVYDVAPPVGKKPLVDFGGDLLYLSQNGLIPLSKLAQSILVDRSQAISFRIDGAFLEAAENYGSVSGWCMTVHKKQSALIVNVPISADTVSYQYVMNTITGAWCRFLSWNASCWTVSGSDVYYGGGTVVRKAWVGTSDNGVAISAQISQSYNSYGYSGQKNLSMVRPNISVAGSATLAMAFDADFKTFGGNTQVTYFPLSSSALWDTSLWGTGTWDGGATSVEPRWLTVPGELGYLHSFRLQLTTSTASFSWTSTNFAYRPAGIL